MGQRIFVKFRTGKCNFFFLLLFGGKKIPELMRGVGKGVRSFKEGVNGVEEEIKKPVEKAEEKKEPAAEAAKPKKKKTAPETDEEAAGEGKTFFTR